MSKHFITGKYYEDPIKNDQYTNIKFAHFSDENPSKSRNDSVEMPMHDKFDNRFMIIPPANIEDESYGKGMTECTINLFKLISEGCISKGKDKLDKQRIPEELAMIIKQVANAMAYTVNCDSWDSGELKSYDYDEIKRRLSLVCGDFSRGKRINS